MSFLIEFSAFSGAFAILYALGLCSVQIFHYTLLSIDEPDEAMRS